MMASDISKIINSEIKSAGPDINSHGLDLNRCLVGPVKKTYEDSFHQGKTLELWLVLEEDPDNKSGYKIVFDEGSNRFGLAIRGDGKFDTFIGFHGSFTETLKGM